MRKDIFYLLVTCAILHCVTTLVDNDLKNRRVLPNYGLNMHKVALTQHGYIQFLRYITHIPPIQDFTFCIWLMSSNLTHAHPLLSYSEHEQDRFIRAWVSPRGHEINLAIRETQVLRVPVHLREHKWYHICQSWSTRLAHAVLFVDGKLVHSEYNNKIRGITLPGKGDLVVGQEYTDFDKGLEDGIEGQVFGFNMVLAAVDSHKAAPTFPVSNHIRNYYQPIVPINLQPSSIIKEHHFHQPQLFEMKIRIKDDAPPVIFDSTNVLRRVHEVKQGDAGFVKFENPYAASKTKPVMPQGRPYVLRRYKRTIEHTEPSLEIIASKKNTTEEPIDSVKPNAHSKRSLHESDDQEKNTKSAEDLPSLNRNSRYINGAWASNNGFRNNVKSLGQQLVELSYGNCLLGRGAPLEGPGVLISWTKTPVRVFGGAVLKPASPSCGHF